MSEASEETPLELFDTASASYHSGRFNLMSEDIYMSFPDGWRFVADAGNSDTRAEVFTPYPAVQEMMVEMGLFPAAAIYDGVYDVPREEALRIVRASVYEPGVGTGNIIASVLWHKLEFAALAAVGERLSLNSRLYNFFTLEALASLYANDVDMGNLQTVKWRLLHGLGQHTQANTKFWCDYLRTHLSDPPEEEAICLAVDKSLSTAKQEYHSMSNGAGVLDAQYRNHTGRPAPQWLRLMWSQILDSNLLLFNSIDENDTVTEDAIFPGWAYAKWTRWLFTQRLDRIEMDRRIIPYALQMHSARLDSMKAAIARIEARKVPARSPLGVETTVFATDEDAKMFKDVTAKLRKEERLIKKLHDGEELTVQEMESSSSELSDELTLFDL